MTQATSHRLFELGTIYKPPLFVVESVSQGHERHDRVTKRGWYAEAGIPHYWLLTEFERSLVCLVLREGEYVEEDSGENNDILASSIFGGVNIPLARVWEDVKFVPDGNCKSGTLPGHNYYLWIFHA